MYLSVVLTIFILNIVLSANADLIRDPRNTNNDSNEKKCCYEQATFTCCEGFILQVQNLTTASCIECIPPGQSCYQVDRPCCPGYRCGSGPVVYSDPRPTDKCISELLRG